ncbi:MAG TPA: hypothetical protein VN241_09515 [Microbacterium sp.]|nr:hypothetical protein [Microbacterium sp.]
MRTGDDPLDAQKPMADLQEQQRSDLENPEDPEAPSPGAPDFAQTEADPADLAEQHDEIPLDDDHQRDDLEEPIRD